MYNTIKNVISQKKYNLADMLKKINTIWVMGHISEEQVEELTKMAQGNAKVESSVDVFKKLSELTVKQAEIESRIKALEDAMAGGGSETEEPTEETYSAFEVGKWYYAGDKVVFKKKNYVCIAPEGTVCVWSPKDYPAYWELVN